jgi:hypothetical protein
MARTVKRQFTLDDAMAELRSVASPQIATIYERRNPGIDVLGVRYGDIAKMQKGIAPDAVLAASLWATGILEARILALRVLPKGTLPEAQIDAWVQDLNFPPLADEFAQAVYHTPFAREKMEAWMGSERDLVRRAGYSLLYGFAADRASDIEYDAWLGYLDRIGREIHQSPNWSREMMNLLPIAIGLREPALFQPALDTAAAYGKIDVFHGDNTNCRIEDAVVALNNPRTKIKAY